MCSAAPPPSPNYQGAAIDQGNANANASRLSSRLNNPNVYGPTGSQVTTWDGDTPSVFQLLSPEQQLLYDQGVGNASMMGSLAQQGLSRMGGVGGELNFSGAPAMPGAYKPVAGPSVGSMPGALDPNSLPALGNYEDTRTRVMQAMLGRSTEALDQRGEQMNSDLIARGLRPGTEAYAREQDALNRARNDAQAQAELAGGNAAAQAFDMDLSRRGQFAGEQSQQFNQRMGADAQRFGQELGAGQFGQSQQAQGFSQGMAGRLQAIQEALMQRQIPFSEIQTLLSGSRSANPFQMPGFQGGANVAPPPLYGAAQQQSGYNTDVYNLNQGNRNSNVQAGVSLLSNFPWAELFK